MSDLMPPAQVVRGAQPAANQQLISSLASALMRPTQMPNLQSPTSDIPLGTMLQLMQQQGNQNGQPSMLSNIGNGVANIFQGNQWDGMPGQSALNALDQQAAGNIAAGAAL